MPSSIRDFVMSYPLFSHHDHHWNPRDFDKERERFDFRNLLGYAEGDLITAAGVRSESCDSSERWIATHWPRIRCTGYGQAVALGCKALFELDYEPVNFAAITEAMSHSVRGKTATEVYDYFVRVRANNKWILQDGLFRPGNEHLLKDQSYPEYYRFAWRMDDLFSVADSAPISLLEKTTGREVLCLEHLVDAMNANIDIFKATGRLASFKIGIAYQRDLSIGDPVRHDAERAFTLVRSRKIGNNGRRQYPAPLDLSDSRPLADYMLHKLIQRANDENMPVQIHTGYLAGHWGDLEGTRAIRLLPLFDKYRKVRFDVFHASWPWGSELGAIAKNYPNVYPDMCWAWAMNPIEAERALDGWLDGVPFNKILAYGADTGLPWCNVGYSIQARNGIARVLDRKIEAGAFSQKTAEEIASAIMVTNGEDLYRLRE